LVFEHLISILLLKLENIYYIIESFLEYGIDFN
jgi:hypothetical protein